MAASALSSLHAVSGIALRSASTTGPSRKCIAKAPPCSAKHTDNAAATTPPAPEAPKSAEHTHRTSRRRLIMGTVATGMITAIGCPLCDQGLNLQSAMAADWSYGDYSGPNQWGDLCQTGTAQSPIDLPSESSSSGLVVDNSPGPIKFGYHLAAASYLNTGHGTMQVNFPAGSNTVTIGDRKLELLQYHFHAPSEHSFNGVRSAMEAHLVHRDEEGKLAVVGVMLEGSSKASRNLCVEAALAFAPDEKGTQIGAPVQCFDVPVPPPEEEEEVSSLGPKTIKQCVKIQISPKPLVPKPDREDGTHSYIHYKGSLTTPPCSEGVDWFVLLSPVTVPDAQVVEFMRYVGDKRTLALNSRPRQDLGDRSLYLGPTVAVAQASSPEGNVPSPA